MDAIRFHNLKLHSITPDEFAEFYDQILSRAKQDTTAEIILIDPFYISTDTARGAF